MYTVFYHPRTQKFLSKIPKKDAQKILDTVSLLAKDPFVKSLDVKKLATTASSFRLRVNTIRVIYELDTKKLHLYVHEIAFRGSIY